MIIHNTTNFIAVMSFYLYVIVICKLRLSETFMFRNNQKGESNLAFYCLVLDGSLPNS